MKVINLTEKNSVLNSYMAQIRDKVIQKDPVRFRKNIEKIGEIFAYEISRTLNYSVKEVNTPLGISSIATPDDKIVAATILRAGLPLHQGILNVFGDAESAFVAAYRKTRNSGEMKISMEYCNCPNLDGKVLILADVMLATGSSIEQAYRSLCENGTPSATHFVSAIVSRPALDILEKTLPDKVTLWTAGIDEELTTKAYIVPGLGDAGDLAYGTKR